MKKIILIAVGIFNIWFTYGQYVPRNVSWEINMGERKTSQEARTVIPTPDSCYLIAGYVELKDNYESKLWKIDNNGKLIWQKTFNEGFRNIINVVANTRRNTYMAAGGFVRRVGGIEKLDAIVVEFDSKGEIIKKQLLGGTENEVISALMMLDDGGFITVGYTESAGNGRKDMWIARFNKEHIIVWEKFYGGKKDDGGKSITKVIDGGYLVCGYTESKGEGKKDLWIVKMDENGNMQREMTFGENEDEVGNYITNTADGGYIAVGYSNTGYVEAVGDKGRELLALKMDANLKIQWGDKRTFGDFGNDEAYSVINTADRGYTVCGYTESKEANGKSDLWLLRIGEFGNQEWIKYLGGRKDDKGIAMSATMDGAYIVAGYTESKGNSKRDLWVLKLRDDEVVEAGKSVEFASSLLKPKEFEAVAQSDKKWMKFDYRTAYINYYPEIENYVNAKMTEWAKKGVYETTEAYSRRITLLNSIKQEELFTQEAINQYAPKQIKLNGGLVEIDGIYNPEKQTFRLKVPNTQPIDVHVPVAGGEAPEFEKNWTTYRFQDIRFGLYNKKFVIANANIIVNNKIYPFDARKTTEYGKDMQLTINGHDEKQLRVSAVFSEIIKNVRDSMEVWEQKGEFETQSDFAKRTSGNKKTLAEERFTQAALAQHAPQKLKLNNLELDDYNSEKQIFPVEVPNSEYFAVPVPLDTLEDKFATAKFVKENWDTYQLMNIKYGIYDYKYVIYEADISVADSLTFHYFAPDMVEYGKQIQTSIKLNEVDYGMLDAYTYKSLFPNEEARGDPPALLVTNLTFKDFDGNNQIDANEKTKIHFTLINNGKGKAYRMNCKMFEMNGVTGLDFEKSKSLGDLEPGEKMDIVMNVNGKTNLSEGKALFKIRITEGNRNNPDEEEISLVTNRFVEPELAVNQWMFSSETGGNIKSNKTVYLKLRIKNTGKGTAQNVKVKFINPDNTILAAKKEFELGAIVAGEEKQITYQFIPSDAFKKTEIPIQVIATEQFGKYGDAKTITVKKTDDLIPYTQYDIASDVDVDIPKIDTVIQNRFAIIIGNEDYTKYQSKLGSESNVEFAAADAIVFRRYAENVLGIQKENIRFVVNARKHEMTKMIDEVVKLARTAPGGNSEIIFFYAGHGFPDERTQEPYIMPVDISGADVTNGIKLSDLYTQLTLSTNVKRATVFIDACFSGGGRESGLLAARAVKIKPKETPLLKGNLVVFSASSGDQTALPYSEKNHGMFTYALLKKLKETKGDITYGFLDEFIRLFVENKSQRVNNKEQNPKTNVSRSAIESWKDWKVK